MNFTKQMLRFLDPHTEDLRMQLREKMAEADAHAEDVCRTIVMDGRKIAEAVRSYHESTASKRP